MRMQIGLSMSVGMEQRDPVDYVKELFRDSDAAQIQVDLGQAILTVNTSLVSTAQLNRISTGEKFAAVFTVDGRVYLFINPNLACPTPFKNKVASFMALNAFLTATRTSEAYPDSIKIEERPIVIEMAYAKSVLTPKEYRLYKKWRTEIGKTDFFNSEDWETHVDLAHAALPTIISGIIRIAELERDNFDVIRKQEIRGTRVTPDMSVRVRRKEIVKR